MAERPQVDDYATDTHRWWHLSRPSPKLVRALDEGWLVAPGRVLDLGCGLGSELALLALRGFVAVGVDLSPVALRRASVAQPEVHFVRADVLGLPFDGGSFDVLLDRGCFHYLGASERATYAAEAWRVLKPRGRLFLRACLPRAGIRNEIEPHTIRDAFRNWRVLSMEQEAIVSDTRTMPALVALLERNG